MSHGFIIGGIRPLPGGNVYDEFSAGSQVELQRREEVIFIVNMLEDVELKDQIESSLQSGILLVDIVTTDRTRAAHVPL